MFKHVKINDYGVQCFLCDLWVHKACENISDETFKIFDLQNAESGQYVSAGHASHVETMLLSTKRR